MYDVEEEQTLYALKEWITQARDYSTYKANVMLALWGNKNDSDGSEAPKFEGAIKGFLETNYIPESLHFRVSAKTGYNVREAFDAVIAALHTNVTCGRMCEDDRDLLSREPAKAKSGCC